MQFIDLKAQYSVHKKEIDTTISQVLEHGQYIMGKEVSEFENMMSEFIGVKHCISCANGTDALQLVFMANDIGRGDAVFAPNITFIASIEPACMLGATPVFCDIENDTYNICAESLEKQIKNVLSLGKHTPKAVVAVDFLGNPCNYDKIQDVCNKYNLLLIEDAAQSIGASYKGVKCGNFGNVSTTSFFPAKPLGCYGDGGAVFTNDDNLAQKFRSLKVHGKGTSKYDNIRIGVNSRLDTIQAAILKVKLKALQNYELENRQQIAMRYNDAFKNKLITPFVLDGGISVYAQYALLADSRSQRDYILKHLSNKNIPNMIYYPTPQHLLKVFEGNIYLEESFEASTNYCSRTFSLPFHPYLSEEDQQYIIKTVLEVI